MHDTRCRYSRIPLHGQGTLERARPPTDVLPRRTGDEPRRDRRARRGRPWREAADRLGFDRTATDWRDVVDEVDVFYNLGPNHVHREPSIAALEAGTPVFCEKPLAPTLAGAQRWPTPPTRRASPRDGVQLPLRPGDSVREEPDRRRRTRRDTPLPRKVPSGLARRPDGALELAQRRGDGWQRRAGRPGCPHHRPGALPARRRRGVHRPTQRPPEDVRRRATGAGRGTAEPWRAPAATTPSRPAR